MTYDYRADPILGEALAYWLRKRGDRAMPRKRDIDPVEIAPKILPHLQIIEVVGERFRYRLVGTAMVQAYGREYTGTYPDEIFTPDRACLVQAAYRAAVEARRPVFTHNRYFTAKTYELRAHRIYLPLSDDGRTVQFLLAATQFAAEFSYKEGMWGYGTGLDPAAQRLETIDLSIAIAASPGRKAA